MFVLRGQKRFCEWPATDNHCESRRLRANEVSWIHIALQDLTCDLCDFQTDYAYLKTLHVPGESFPPLQWAFDGYSDMHSVRKHKDVQTSGPDVVRNLGTRAVQGSVSFVSSMRHNLLMKMWLTR